MLGDSIKKFALSQAFSYIEKDPIKNLTHVMDMVDKFAGEVLFSRIILLLQNNQ